MTAEPPELVSLPETGQFDSGAERMSLSDSVWGTLEMKLMRSAFFAAVLACSGVAGAQSWTPGSEIIGQTVQVETNGVVNSITFNADGSASIATPSGRIVPASWTATGNQLCLTSGAQTECFPYSQAFQAGQTVTITSNCNATSRWLASSVNPPASELRAGERG